MSPKMPSSIARDLVFLAQRIDHELSLPKVRSIHLPPRMTEPSKSDEFGFVMLEDGSVGPFYTRLDDDLHQLWHAARRGFDFGRPLYAWIEGWLDSDQSLRALALGAYNAMSDHVMRRAGFDPTQVQDSATANSMHSDRFAIVGYIKPMVERRLEQGATDVLVLERNPQRVDAHPKVRVSNDPRDLRHFSEIVCTASTLINDSLHEILACKPDGGYLALIGPSGSGLPDVLFEHGVSEVGGFYVTDAAAFASALASGMPWGKAGSKYHLTPATYPGIDKLLASIQNPEQ